MNECPSELLDSPVRLMKFEFMGHLCKDIPETVKLLRLDTPKDFIIVVSYEYEVPEFLLYFLFYYCCVYILKMF